MKRFGTALIAGAFGILSIAPCAIAQSWQDMHEDREQIEHKERQINHDQHELNEDLENGDYGAARHEQREIRGRERQLQYEKQDLRGDMARRMRHHDDDD